MDSTIAEEDRKNKRKKELIQEAFHQLLEGKNQNQKQKQKQKQKGLEEEEEEEGGEEELLISRLLTKLDSVERGVDSIDSFENSHEQGGLEPESKPESSSIGKSRTEEADLNEMARDLRRVKRQNLITHCLLSVIVVGIAVWQFNEVAFLLAVKAKFSNPLGAVGDAIKGSIRWRGKKQKPQVEAPPLPPVGVPELPREDQPKPILPKLILNDEE